jgi:hypothetical protein
MIVSFLAKHGNLTVFLVKFFTDSIWVEGLRQASPLIIVHPILGIKLREGLNELTVDVCQPTPMIVVLLLLGR